jgi:LacI family transcriptional regulator
MRLTDDPNPSTKPAMRGHAKRSTIIDVARVAGVSTKTVSRVLNGEPHVTSDLQARVHAAVTQLKYQPNVLAQGLVRRRSYLIGLVYENPSPSYVVELQMGALHRLTNERYRLVVLPVRSVHEKANEIARLLRATAIDGVVLAPPASDHPVVLRDLEEMRLPFARISPTDLLGRGPSNLIDDVAAAQEIANHIIALGHRRIAVIKGDPSHPSSAARLLGYSQALEAAQIELRSDWIQQGFFTHESGHAAGRRLLGGKDRPTAILAQNDDMAVGALMAAREIGIAVPEELSIVGFDDSEISRIVWPRLTTVRQPVFEMAVAATDMLLDQLDGAATMTAATRWHAHELLVRESAAAPPG